MQSQPATIIEIRPLGNGWQVYEGPGVQPVLLTKEQAMSYAQKSRVLSLGRDSHFGFDRESPTNYFA
jgi:hypothetical protein